MTTNDTYDLLSLLPSTSYTLAYTLPLFFVSALLTFAGCFFTLDRTRASSPTKQIQARPPEKPSPISWLEPKYLGGGVGGLCAGFAFGVHFSTLLSLLLPSTTSTSPLGHKAFLAIWVAAALICLALCGKWKYAAIAVIGLSGFCTLALAISVIVHPPLLSRIVLAAVFALLGTVVCLLPFPCYARVVTRIATSSLGAFGLTVSVALFAHSATWGNVWERLWVLDGIGWGNSKEKGLSAAFCFLFALGLISDWFLHTKIGENPDEKWDRYLAEYTSELPHTSRRAGTFTPLISIWDRLLGNYSSFAPVVQPHDLVFPGDVDVKMPLPTSPAKLSKQYSLFQLETFSDVPESKLRLALLYKNSGHGARDKSTRQVIKFRPHDSDASSDSEDDGPSERSSSRARPSITDSTSTVVEAQNTDENSSLKALERPWDIELDEVPDHEDKEDIANIGRRSGSAGKPVWQPEFIRRHSTHREPTLNRPSVSSGRVPLLQRSGDNPQKRERIAAHTSDTSRSTPPLAEVTSIPATPSLIRAVERIQLAHEAIPRSQPPLNALRPATISSQSSQRRRKSWDVFWNDVKMKAHY